MAIHIDPDRNEVRALEGVTDWRGRRVLEIGCGDGRLTLRLARLGARVHAVDPDAEAVDDARRNLPSRYAGRVRFEVGTAERLGVASAAFDLAVFAWSL
jgi:ubiquinone/menaquinone biosynthesis C-methylase UbiE